MRRDTLVAYLDEYLAIRAFKDYSENGLQVEGADEVERLAFAVDASYATITGAVACGAQMLIVHHGLFWGKPLMVVGPHRRRLQALLDANCSLYAAHLPLDGHPEVGNNVQLARLLGLSPVSTFGEVLGTPVGVIAQAPPGVTRAQLATQLSAWLGYPPLLLAGGPEEIRRVGIISGAAASDIPTAAAAGCDTFITGETSHSHYHDASEYGLNVFFVGHYASETLGLKALADHLGARFGLPGHFLDRPTGL
jgi:dinuclear metal center YbgI/SA1388 family protein